MRVETWLEALAQELSARGVSPSDAASAVVEAQGYLEDSSTSPLDAFGPPAIYAEAVAGALAQQRSAPPRGPARVVVHAVSKAYRNREVLRGVDLEVPAGQVTLLMGPNGCGKSTLLRIIAGLLDADGGTVAVDGTVGYAPQDGGLVEHLRPSEHCALFGSARGLGREAAIDEGQRIAEQLGWDMRTEPIVRNLSGGTRQKLNVTLSMLGRPSVLLLDEPYQGLDLDSTQRFWDLLWAWGDDGGAALVVTHAHDAIERAGAVIELPSLRVGAGAGGGR